MSMNTSSIQNQKKRKTKYRRKKRKLNCRERKGYLKKCRKRKSQKKKEFQNLVRKIRNKKFKIEKINTRLLVLNKKLEINQKMSDLDIFLVQFYKPQMQELISYLFSNFISEQTTFTRQLIKLKPIKLQYSYQMYDQNGLPQRLISSQNFQMIQYLLAKRFVSYSPSNLEVRLNVANVMFYQRIYKIKSFVRREFDQKFEEIIEQFIENQMLPIKINKDVDELLNKSQKDSKDAKKQQIKKSKKKKQINFDPQNTSKNGLDYSRIIVEYNSKKQQSQTKDNELEYLVNIGQLNQLFKYYTIASAIKNQKRQYLEEYNEHQRKFQSLSFIQMYNSVKENKQKALLVNKIRQQVKRQKIENYIMQKFNLNQQQSSKEDPEHQKQQRNILLVFNIVKKYSYLSEKQIIQMSMLPVTEVRKNLGLLIGQGFIHFYAENSKTTLYKLINESDIERKFLDHVAASILKIYMLIDESKRIPKEYLIRLEWLIGELDDVLILFGY